MTTLKERKYIYEGWSLLTYISPEKTNSDSLYFFKNIIIFILPYTFPLSYCLRIHICEYHPHLGLGPLLYFPRTIQEMFYLFSSEPAPLTALIKFPLGVWLIFLTQFVDRPIKTPWSRRGKEQLTLHAAMEWVAHCSNEEGHVASRKRGWISSVQLPAAAMPRLWQEWVAVGSCMLPAPLHRAGQCLCQLLIQLTLGFNLFSHPPELVWGRVYCFTTER